MFERTTRRAVLVALGAAIAGCSGTDGENGEGAATSTPTPASPTPASTPSENPAMGDVEKIGGLCLTSPAFDDGGSIPEKYGKNAQNINPPLTIERVPDDAASLALIMDDPDAVEPAGKVWLHWLVWNIPPSRTEIPEGWEPTDAVEGTNDFDERGYGGPAPPDKTHTYRFKLYALDTTLDLPASAGKREVGQAMQGHLLARTQLDGTYSP